MSISDPFQGLKKAFEEQDLTQATLIANSHKEQIKEHVVLKGLELLRVVVAYPSLNYPTLTPLIEWILAHIEVKIPASIMLIALQNAHYAVCNQFLKEVDFQWREKSNQDDDDPQMPEQATAEKEEEEEVDLKTMIDETDFGNLSDVFTECKLGKRDRQHEEELESFNQEQDEDAEKIFEELTLEPPRTEKRRKSTPSTS